MKNAAVAIGVAALLIGSTACVQPGFKPGNVLNISIIQPGDVYSVENEGSFGVVKILAVESDAVHVRVYKEKYSERPKVVDPNKLTLGSINDRDGFGIGHLPISKATFNSWHPVRITNVAVVRDELIGYEEWKRSGGGVFK